MQKPIFAFALTAFVIAATVGRSALAQTNDKSLIAVARSDGYSVQWLLPDRAVQLYRPGVVVVLHPGATMYEVNDRVEFGDIAPRYINGDMLVSNALAARLGRLAALAAAANRTSQNRLMPVTGPQNAVAGALTLDARRQNGAEAVHVSGHAPSGAPVTITLLATISPDLPTVVLSRNDLQPDVNGQFEATISIAPDYLRDTLVQVLATAPGASPAQAVVVVGPPNAGVNVPFDQPYCPNNLCPL